MTKHVAAKTWTLHEWSDGTHRSWEEPDAPLWTSGIVAGTWGEIGENTIADCDPANDPGLNPNYPLSAPWRGSTGQPSVVSAWNGGFLLPNHGVFGSYGVMGAGHANYFGSEVYLFDLETAIWRMASPPYLGTYTLPVTDGLWPGQIPNMPHTYGHVLADPSRNVVVLARREEDNDPLIVLSAVTIWDPETGTWTNGGEYAGSNNPTNSDGTMAFDWTRNIFWMCGGQTGRGFASYDPGSMTWTEYAAKQFESGTMMGYDPESDCLVMVEAVNGQTLYGIDPASPNNARVTLTQASRPTISSRMGVVYSPRRQAFLVWDTGGDVYEVKKGSGNWDVATWTWTSLTDASNSVTPTRTSNGTFTRFQLAQFGEIEFAVVVNAVNEPVYAFRVP